jgi:hypothetical protein
MEGSIDGLIWGIVPVFAWKGRGKSGGTSVILVAVPADI